MKPQPHGVRRIPCKSTVRVSVRPETHPHSSRKKKTKPPASTVLDNIALSVSGCRQMNALGYIELSKTMFPSVIFQVLDCRWTSGPRDDLGIDWGFNLSLRWKRETFHVTE